MQSLCSGLGPSLTIMRSHEAGQREASGGMMVSRNEHADMNSFSIIALRHNLQIPVNLEKLFNQIDKYKKLVLLVILTNSLLPITTDRKCRSHATKFQDRTFIKRVFECLEHQSSSKFSHKPGHILIPPMDPYHA